MHRISEGVAKVVYTYFIIQIQVTSTEAISAVLNTDHAVGKSESTYALNVLTRHAERRRRRHKYSDFLCFGWTI